ncbi:MAG: zf-TFIIB domain-containing protein [Phycisphaerales bacterium]|nr:zf-TFIIB domain-containing protein [Phycisphaerales bacterium]
MTRIVGVMQCPKCRYDLAGLTEDVCPECGGAFDRADLLSANGAAARAKRLRRVQRRLFVLSVGLAALTVVLAIVDLFEIGVVTLLFSILSLFVTLSVRPWRGYRPGMLLYLLLLLPLSEGTWNQPADAPYWISIMAVGGPAWWVMLGMGRRNALPGIALGIAIPTGIFSLLLLYDDLGNWVAARHWANHLNISPMGTHWRTGRAATAVESLRVFIATASVALACGATGIWLHLPSRKARITPADSRG